MPNIGPIEIIIVLLILLVIFGPKRIPELGRSVGQGMRNFKESVTGRDRGEPDRELESRATPAGPAPRVPPPEPTAGGEATEAEAAAGAERARPPEPTREPRA